MKPVNHKIANVKARGNEMTFVYVVAGKCSCRTKGGGGRGIGMLEGYYPPPLFIFLYGVICDYKPAGLHLHLFIVGPLLLWVPQQIFHLLVLT